MPPSHFASSAQPVGAHRGIQVSGTPPSSWINPRVSSAQSGDPSSANPWLVITQARQEILELRKENQRMRILQGDNVRGRTPVDHPSDFGARYPTIFFIWSGIPLLYVSWVPYWKCVHVYNISCFSNTDLQREVSSGPDGSQSGVLKQKSTRLKLKG